MTLVPGYKPDPVSLEVIVLPLRIFGDYTHIRRPQIDQRRLRGRGTHEQFVHQEQEPTCGTAQVCVLHRLHRDVLLV